MTYPSAWIVGSIVLTTNASITVGGVPVSVPAGEYYLDDPTASLSLVEAVLTAVTPQMTAPAIFIARDRKIRITDSASTTWTAIDSRLQAALGIAASFGPTTSYTAPAVSTLLWSPAYCATTTGHPSGSTGFERPTRAHSVSLSGLTQRTTVHGTAQRLCALSWSAVLRSRAWTEGQDDGAPGDFRRFWREVLLPGQRWKWYPEVIEASPVDATAAVLASPRGPYIVRGLGEGWWSSTVANSDAYSDVALDGMLAAELS
jgi:hypothetical protein